MIIFKLNPLGNYQVSSSTGPIGFISRVGDEWLWNGLSVYLRPKELDQISAKLKELNK